MNSSFYPTFNPTHPIPTTDQQWEEMREVLESVDVLIVPGGEGVYSPDLEGEGRELEFLRRMVGEFGIGGKKNDKDKYLVMVCIGAAVAARAGVLDGRRATTNKMAWGEVTPLGEKVKWYVLPVFFFFLLLVPFSFFCLGSIGAYSGVLGRETSC